MKNSLRNSFKAGDRVRIKSTVTPWEGVVAQQSATCTDHTMTKSHGMKRVLVQMVAVRFDSSGLVMLDPSTLEKIA